MSKPKRASFGWLFSEIDQGYVERRWRGLMVAFLIVCIVGLFVGSFWTAFIDDRTSLPKSFCEVITMLSMAMGIILSLSNNWRKGRMMRWTKTIAWFLVFMLATFPPIGRNWVFDHAIAFLAASTMVFIYWYEGLKEPAPEFFAKMVKSEPSKELK